MSEKDWGYVRIVGALLGLAIALHLLTGRKATQAHALAGFLSLLAVIGPELGS